MNDGFRTYSMAMLERAALRRAGLGWPEKGRIEMNLRITAISLGVAAAVGTCAAFAQPAPQLGAYGQGQGYSQQNSSQQPYKHRHRNGIVALLKEEMSAGRLSQKEGSLLLHKIKQLHAEKRAEREARYGGETAPPQTQQPR